MTDVFSMIHYYILFIIISLICWSSFILSYLLSFIFAICFLSSSDLIVSLISSICFANENVCSNISVNWLRITFYYIYFTNFVLIFFLLLLFFYLERSIYSLVLVYWIPPKYYYFLINERINVLVNFGVLNPSKILWHNYFICIVTFYFIN